MDTSQETFLSDTLKINLEKKNQTKDNKEEKKEKADAEKKAKKEKADAEKKEKKEKADAMKKAKQEDESKDRYTQDVLRIRYDMYRIIYIKTSEIIETTGLPIRHQNPPEDVTENMVKFIIQNYDNDPTCKWAKSIKMKGIKLKGDLWSEKYSVNSPPEVKAFTSDGPSSFGPTKKFSVIYFFDMRGWFNNIFILWRVNLTSESCEWKNNKMNKKDTHEDQCLQGKRPHIAWDNLYPQISDHCVKVYEGTFEGIFTPPITVSVASQ